MGWSLIKSIQSDPNVAMRLVLPFGLALKPGDVISVNRDGSFTLQGNCYSILRQQLGSLRKSPDRYSVIRQSGSGTSFAFRAAGKESTLFPSLPHAEAGFDVSFKSAQGWILAFVDRQLTSIESIDRFRDPILNAYSHGIWKPDWALVYEIAAVERMTLVASTSSDTHVALTVDGSVTPNAATEVKLTANASIAATNNELIQSITNSPATAFCRAMRVKDPWWSVFGPDVGMLDRFTSGDLAQSKADALAAGTADFWEDIDEGLALVDA